MTFGRRIGLGAAFAAWGAFITWFALTAAPNHLAKDFTWPWRAARILLDGHDPYRVIQATGAYPFNTPFLYPLPAALFALPVAPLAPAVAGTVFFALGSGLLAFALSATKEGLARLPLFVSAPFFMAGVLAQWAPLMMAAALIPTLQFLGAGKPNLGLACWLYRPTWRGAVGVLVVLGAAVLVRPDWPGEWRAALAAAPRYRGPAMHLAGAFLLLSLVQWRRPEGRLFSAMAVLPQLSLFYDQLPLWLVPTTVWRSLALSALSWVAWLQWYPSRALPSSVAVAQPLILWLIYVPALLLLFLPHRTQTEVESATSVSPSRGNRAATSHLSNEPFEQGI